MRISALQLPILFSAVLVSVSCSGVSEPQKPGLPRNMGVAITSSGGCSFTAPANWTMSNEAGKSQGVLIVAYPNGKTYSNSPVLVYSRSLPRDSTTRSAADASKAVVQNFRSNGHASHHSRFLTKIQSKGGKEGDIYTFEGDNWGNFEAACYFVESGTINSIVFHAKSKSQYDAYWNEYLQMCRSYLPVFIAN